MVVNGREPFNLVPVGQPFLGGNGFGFKPAGGFDALVDVGVTNAEIIIAFSHLVPARELKAAHLLAGGFVRSHWRPKEQERRWQTLRDSVLPRNHLRIQ